MVNVYDVKVRFMRRLQMREYEPAECEITISAQLSDDDDYRDVSEKLLLDARDLVKSALSGKPVGKTETKVTKTKVDKKAKATDEIPADTNSASEIPADTNSASEIPGDDETVAVSAAEVKKALAAEKRKLAAEKRKLAAVEKKAAAKKAAAANEIPGDDGDEEIPGDDDKEDGELSADKLHEFINSMVTSRKVKPNQIKSILAVYGAARISDVPAENRQDVKDAIELLA